MAYQISDDCLACGTCIGECPVNAITVGDTKYEINTETCLDCGACAAACPVEAPLPEEKGYFSDIKLKVESSSQKKKTAKIQDGNFMLAGNILKTYLGGEESVTIPDTIEVINDSAFARCHELISVEIPDNVKEIRDYAFAVCNGLQEVTLPQNVKLGRNVFYECTELNVIKIRFPGGVVGTFSKEALDVIFQKI